MYIVVNKTRGIASIVFEKLADAKRFIREEQKNRVKACYVYEIQRYCEDGEWHELGWKPSAKSGAE